MSIQDLITEAEWAKQRGVSLRTVQRERMLRIGPPFIKLGKSIFYRPASIEAWLISQEQSPAKGKAA
jgi:hypothetical protein